MKETITAKVDGVELILLDGELAGANRDLWVPRFDWDGPSAPASISEWKERISAWRIAKQIEAQAMVAAALEEAERACERAAYDGTYPQHDMVELGCLRSRDYIRALIPDAGAALDRALEKAREKGRREGQIKAGAIFATSGAEDRWLEDMESACPACGGSGHKDDAAIRAREEGRREEREACARDEAKARIEELEAKLAKAEHIVRILASAEWDDTLGEAVDLACAYLAEVDEEK